MDSNDIMSSIMEVFSNPEAKDKLQGMAEMLAPTESSGNKPADPFADEMIMTVGKMVQSFNKHDDRIGLLTSIKPYMKSGRSKNIDMAIRLIQLMNFATDFNMKDVK